MGSRLSRQLLGEIADTGELSRSSWRSFMTQLDELSDDEVLQVCAARGAAGLRRLAARAQQMEPEVVVVPAVSEAELSATD